MLVWTLHPLTLHSHTSAFVDVTVLFSCSNPTSWRYPSRKQINFEGGICKQLEILWTKDFMSVTLMSCVLCPVSLIISPLLVLSHQLKNLPKPLILKTNKQRNKKHEPLFLLYIKPSLYFLLCFNLLLHVPGHFFIWVVSLVIWCGRQSGSLSWTPLFLNPRISSFPSPFQWGIGPKWAH